MPIINEKYAAICQVLIAFFELIDLTEIFLMYSQQFGRFASLNHNIYMAAPHFCER